MTVRNLILVLLCVAAGACGAPEAKQLTHAEAMAAAEEAAGLAAGTLGDIATVHAVFLRCSNQMSVITPPSEQQRCYGAGAALITYFNGRRWDWDPEDLAGWERIPLQRMEALGWKNGSRVEFKPLSVR